MTRARGFPPSFVLAAIASAWLAGCPDAVPVVVGKGGNGGTGGNGGASTGCSGDALFANDQAYPAGGKSFALADVNSDGRPDLAVLVAAGVDILLNDGDGAFKTAPKTAMEMSPVALAVADVDADGKPDLVVASNAGMDAIGVMLGDGSGAFGAPAHTFLSTFGINAIAAADVNGDTKPDVVYTTAQGVTGGLVSVLLNDGTGKFPGPPADLAAFGVPQALVLADLNGDTKLDIAVAKGGVSTGNGQLQVLLNDGQGGFTSLSDVPAGSNPVSIVAADLNDDNATDLAIADKGAENVRVFFGDKTGNFVNVVDFDVGASGSITAADFDDDGKVDLAVSLTDPNGGAVSVMLNDGKGSFGTVFEYLKDASTVQLAAADLNGDGKLDIAVSVATDDVKVLLNECK